MAWIIIGALAFMFILLFTFSLGKVSGESAEAEERVAAETPAPKTTIRYPVPLDGELQEYILAECQRKEVAPSIVFAVIGAESQYRADAIGDHGNSFGLMQIYKSVHEDRMRNLGVSDLLNPYENVTVGIDILSELLDRGNGIEWALSYYCGYGGAECEYARTVIRSAEQIMEGVMVTSGIP